MATLSYSTQSSFSASATSSTPSIAQRANTVAIPTLYPTGGTSSAIVVAAVLGSVIGFTALVWLLTAYGSVPSGTVPAEEVTRRQRSSRRQDNDRYNDRSGRDGRDRADRKSSNGGSGSHRSRQQNASPPPMRQRSRSNRRGAEERIIREERVIREVPRQVPAARRSSGMQDVPSRSKNVDDIVYVYEEESLAGTNDRRRSYK